ncbi:MAG: SIR2 family protein [Candidatus Omnitrophica bacterium]|nr:SIR2 family protein [Candidatus Omnitrophota bacterium]MDD5501100.1 SIR2 family protein [Candidatus Omnitrophota bacterium]
MITWPDELVNDVARRRSVIFLGSGISCNSRGAHGEIPKAWKELLESASTNLRHNRHIKSLLKKQDYLTSCEIIKRALGRDKFHQLLRDNFSTPRFAHAPIHEVIFKLDSRIVATPNFDKIYETYASHEAKGSIIIKHHYDDDVAEIIRSDARIILKVHGTIDTLGKMIFTRKEYAAARSKYENFYMLLKALALTHTFLFLGCGVNDPDIKLLLEDNFFLHPTQRSHFFVSSKRELHPEIIDIIEDTMNLKVLQYDKKDNHRELLESINNLVEQVEHKREELRRTSNW